VSVLRGARAPERFQIAISNAELAAEPLDLTTVTAFALQVTNPKGEASAWSVDVVDAAAADLVTLEHVFDADGAEVELPGNYSLLISMTVPSGVRRAGPTTLPVT
jgi:hypothetical protein